eukprot:4503532-Karenia_brevis.AAC.1
MSEEPVRKDDEDDLGAKEQTKYKSVTARANYLSQDRPEIQFATKECSKSMSNPKKKDMQKLKRLGRYLKGHLRTTSIFRWQSEVEELTVFTDANWAGDKGTR